MKEINKDTIDNEEIVDFDEKNQPIDITSDQIITLDDIDKEINELNENIQISDSDESIEINDANENIQMIDSSENIELNDMDENIEMIANDEMSKNETDNSEEESNELIKNDIPSEVIETKDANDLSFMNEIKNPINHADNEYTLKNVLKSSNNGELEYMEEMKQKIYNKKELIHIYPRMFFWKKWKAKKINEQIIMEMEMEFQDNYQNVLAFRNEYKAKMKEYEHKQRIYKESLFKL